MVGFPSFESTRRLSPRSLSLLAGAFTLSLAAATLAGPRGPEFPISVTEARDRAEARFQALDGDGSGEISVAEMAAAPEAQRFGHHVRHRHMRHDGPHRGAANRVRERHGKIEEMNAGIFDRLDADGDGLLSRSEFDERKIRAARHAAMQEHFFARLDEDGSGGLSRDELRGTAHRLETMDADGDGTVTREEARTYRESRRQARREAPADQKG